MADRLNESIFNPSRLISKDRKPLCKNTSEKLFLGVVFEINNIACSNQLETGSLAGCWKDLIKYLGTSLTSYTVASKISLPGANNLLGLSLVLSSVSSIDNAGFAPLFSTESVLLAKMTSVN